MPTPPDTRTAARRDASMSLLTSLLNDTLDPGYAETAARREARGEGGGTSHWTKRFSPTVLVGVAALALVLVIAAIQTHQQAPAAEKERQQLISRVQDAERKNSADEAMISTVRGQLQAAQAEALGPEQGKAFTAMSVVTGASPVTGPGLQIVLGDAAGADGPSSSDPRQQSNNESRVLDLDLQHAANGLWAAGAEAVAINGQRLTSLSAIRTAGSAIMVDFRPLSSPYTIQAIGDPKSMAAKFADGADGRYLFELKSQYGIQFDTNTKSKLSLPAATQLSLTDAVPAQ
ncbi:DUF881 domain-containing protein [Catenulispora pinisilvae]|uniref:DUF881 domain-containing protein n=1 Tax=Catenulispora pinisilvae TaxID=2705253 RepID=UPI0018919E05|nr:DUF881 domain-containing protein [Catenulispora pinisilvae]